LCNVLPAMSFAQALIRWIEWILASRVLAPGGLNL
jgi:hypothetical protein